MINNLSDSLIDYLGQPGNNDPPVSDRIYGVVTAVVTNTQDEGGLGRVKVNFTFMAEESESDWIRVAAFMAGSERGAFFLPEVDDEVLVAFEHGNIDTPYIIGVLWSTDVAPPDTNDDGENNLKIIQTRAGHTVTFNDSDDAALIEIKTNGGHTVTLDDTSDAEKFEIVDSTGSNKITIDSSANSITIESSDALNIKGSDITIEASGTLSLTGNSVSMEADSDTTIKGSSREYQLNF